MLDRKDINFKMLYCGYWSTVLRDMPFSLIQFPIWEYFKKIWSLHVDREILPIESAVCGAIAGLKFIIFILYIIILLYLFYYFYYIIIFILIYYILLF